MSKVSSWLQRQKKADLQELANSIGFTDHEGLLKVDLDAALQEYLEENAARLSGDTRLAPFYRRSAGSPIKRESSSALDNGDSTSFKKPIGRPVRRVTKAAEDLSNAISTATPSLDSEEDESEPDVMAARTRSAVARTPARNNQVALLQNASSIPLPPSPAVIANNIERQTTLIRNKISSGIQDSGIIETAEATRETLSTVSSVHLAILAFELYALRQEVLGDKHAFTIPAITTNYLPNFLHTSAWPVKLPDFFLLLSSDFWNPTLLWAFSTLVLPLLVSYFVNLSLTTSTKHRSGKAPRPIFDPVSYVFDPLTFNIVKALLVYVVFGKGATFGGLVDPTSVDRINSALYGGWPSVLTGTGIGGLVTLYEAMLKK